MSPVVAALIIQGVVILLLVGAGAGLYRRIRELELATFHGVGLTVANVMADGRGGLVTPGRRSIVLKINRRCPVCEDILDALEGLLHQVPTDAEVVVVSDDPNFDRPLPSGVRVIRDPAVWRATPVPYAPALLVVDERGTVTFTSPVGSGEVLDELLRTSMASKEVQP